MVTIKILADGESRRERGVYPESIVRRVFGRDAMIYWHRDPQSQGADIVRVDKYGTHVLGKIVDIEEA